MHLLAVLLLLTSITVAGAEELAGDSSRATFLAGEAASKAMKADGGRYYSHLDPAEIAVKSSGRVLTDADCDADCARDRYRELVAAAASEFSDDEQRAIKQALVFVRDYFEAHFPSIAGRPWRFVKTEGWVEGGMPFTLGDTIVFPQTFLDIAMGDREATPDKSTDQLTPFLIHEQFHVLQRIFSREFAELYESWGYTPADIEVPAGVRRQLALNPDGTDSWVRKEAEGWFWPGWTMRRRPTNVRPVAVKLESLGEGVFRAVEVRPFADMEMLHQRFAAFGPTAAHPNELSATMLAQAMHLDANGREIRSAEMREGLAWARRVFGPEREAAD